MADREDEPTDLFDVICRLDDLADWLKTEGHSKEAEQLHATSTALKGCVMIRLAEHG